MHKCFKAKEKEKLKFVLRCCMLSYLMLSILLIFSFSFCISPFLASLRYLSLYLVNKDLPVISSGFGNPYKREQAGTRQHSHK